ncbi:MAG: sigma-54-dependent Fis family transcriptional regulator [Planctomycetes bacterium]|nr:sigma-54-dependent Fis family transcriptional regulator [Planctomycetota bacterium]
MAVHVEITDRGGVRSATVDADSFWIGTTPTCAVQLDVPDVYARIVELRVVRGGAQLEIRAEPGLPFPVRCATGNVGARFQTVLDGDVINAGPAMLRLRVVAAGAADATVEEIDLGRVTSPGAPVGPWYETFMQVADHLEGLRDPRQMVRTAMQAVLGATSADRVYLSLEPDVLGPGGGEQFHLGADGSEAPFRVSSSLVDRVREAGRVVHVPVAAADPIASRFVSVQREGISSGIALPLTALGRRLGVLYADCVRPGAVLSAEDLQRVAFVARLLASALGNRTLVATLARRDVFAAGQAEHPALRTRSPNCEEMVARVRLYAPTDYTVLLRGETGTGKEVLARAIHDLSRRSDGPFVPVNCAAIPEQLMESMLFGHEKGAFTGALQSREGHFQEAHGGTLFLDEIGDMALDLQAKILRVLQDREVTPVGATRRVRVDVRIVAATHQDLESMVGERRFREDLYYRLRELEIVLPPLRARLEDLLPLTALFLEEAADELGLDEPPELSSEALEDMRRRTWRGNIRELRHLVKGAALRAGGKVIRIDHLDAAPGRSVVAAALPVGPALAVEEPLGALPVSGATWKERLELQERAALEETLRQAGGNLTKAARLFGVPRTTYREKLVKAGLLDADAQ